MLKLALAPVLLGQGLWVRARTPRLPEAAGPRAGRCEGSGEPLRLLVLGDSSAAGVGVAQQHQALAQPLARAWAQQQGRPVHWQLHARTGCNTPGLAALLPRPATAVDVAVVVSGVNDVVDRLAPAAAVAARQGLQGLLHTHWQARQVLHLALPPMGQFTALPQPLRWLAGREAAAHDQALREWAEGQVAARHVPLPPMRDASLLAADGFHPGAGGYRLMVQAVLQALGG